MTSYYPTPTLARSPRTMSTTTHAMRANAPRTHDARTHRRDARCGAKKAARKAAGAKKPGGGGALSSDEPSSGTATATAMTPAAPARSLERKPRDDHDDVVIPYGNASGAALRMTEVMLSVADTDLLSEANMEVMPGQVVGLVGGNGCGKSTLIKCIAGKRSVQDGTIAISPDLEVGYFEQTAVSGSQLTVYQEARARMDRINAAEAALKAAEQACESSDDVEACRGADILMDCLAEMEASGAYEAEKRIANVLDGLGFARSQWDVKCDDLSGGWQMRVALARLLLSPAGSGDKGLLLLDEPTNHLDEAAKRWLANWIKESPCTTLIISHEAELLNSACSHIAEVRGKAVHWYTGNFAKFLVDRDERIRIAKATYEKQQAEEADLKDFIRRFSANASKSTQAQSRAKLLEKLQKEMRKTVAAASATVSEGAAGDASRMHLQLAKPPPSDMIQLTLKDGVIGYDPATPILEGSIVLERGMRVVVLGPNGAGKSSLLKSISGQMPLIGGERILGDRVSLGVFGQDLAQYLPKESTCIQYVLDVARVDDPLMKDEMGRQALGALGITGPMALRKIGSLSGGEKARVALAAFVLQPRNCLLLDEPSNHLDVGAVQALTDGLQGWDGCLFAVSHNKGFCESLNPTHIIRVKNGKITMENCYGLSDDDFEHEVIVGDATAAAAAAAGAAAEEAVEEKELVVA